MSNTEKQTGYITLTAGEALEERRRVKLDASQQAVYADAGEAAIGVTTRAASASGQATVRLLVDPGTFIIEAAGTITAGATVYCADDGKISATQSGKPVGTALEAGTASNNCEILPDNWQNFLTQYDTSGL